jgi:hypothetical protein
VLAAAALSSMLSEAPPLERLPDRASVALIDSAHANAYSREMWREDSVGGLMVSLQRDGYLPLLIEGRFPPRHMGGSALPVLLDPREPLSRAELRDLVGHLDRGGDLLAAAGESGGRALGPLLARYGISIGSTPLGPHPIRPDMTLEELERAMGSPQFRRAHPVLDQGLYPSRIHYRAFERDVVKEVMTPAGGRLIVLADPDFLTDRVLENEHAAWEGNVSLLSRLLTGKAG